MKYIVEKKIEEKQKLMNDYLEMLEIGSFFTDEYIIERIKECRTEINVLKEVIEEYENN